MLHKGVKTQTFPPQNSSFSDSTQRQPNRSFTPPPLITSLPPNPEDITSLYCLNKPPPTIHPLNKAPTGCPKNTASSHLTTEPPALLPSHADSSSCHLTSHDRSARHKITTSHSTSSVEDWIDRTSRGTPTSTLTQALQGTPTITQPSFLTKLPISKAKAQPFFSRPGLLRRKVSTVDKKVAEITHWEQDAYNEGLLEVGVVQKLEVRS